MAKHAGRNFRVQLHDGTDWVHVPGERSTSAKLNNESVDTTDKDGVPWRGLTACGIRSGEITLGGVVRDDETKVIFNLLMAASFSGVTVTLRVESHGGDTIMEGPYKVISIERSGEHNNAEMYNITFSTAAAVAGSSTSSILTEDGIPILAEDSSPLLQEAAA